MTLISGSMMENSHHNINTIFHTTCTAQHKETTSLFSWMPICAEPKSCQAKILAYPNHSIPKYRQESCVSVSTTGKGLPQAPEK